VGGRGLGVGENLLSTSIAKRFVVRDHALWLTLHERCGALKLLEKYELICELKVLSFPGHQGPIACVKATPLHDFCTKTPSLVSLPEMGIVES